jgi:hypothetical protein
MEMRKRKNYVAGLKMEFLFKDDTMNFTVKKVDGVGELVTIVLVHRDPPFKLSIRVDVAERVVNVDDDETPIDLARFLGSSPTEGILKARLYAQSLTTGQVERVFDRTVVVIGRAFLPAPQRATV